MAGMCWGGPMTIQYTVKILRPYPLYVLKFNVFPAITRQLRQISIPKLSENWFSIKFPIDKKIPFGAIEV